MRELQYTSAVRNESVSVVSFAHTDYTKKHMFCAIVMEKPFLYKIVLVPSIV
jgi:hypothetical protein